MNFIHNISNLFNIPQIGIKDIIEILILALAIYLIITWAQKTKAWSLLKGFFLIVVGYFIASVLNLTTIVWVLDKTLSVGVIAVVVILQPELRRILEQLGSKGFLAFSVFSGTRVEGTFDIVVVNEIVQACEQMSAACTGALICIEQNNSLDDIERTGISVDAVVSSAILVNIFEHNTPLHDGAAVISHDRVKSATCYLPLSDNMEVSKSLGTRHRAALGISEVNDCITIVVSEETGHISIAREGRLQQKLSPADLRDELMHLVEQDEKRNFAQFLRRQRDGK